MATAAPAATAPAPALVSLAAPAAAAAAATTLGAASAAPTTAGAAGGARDATCLEPRFIYLFSFFYYTQESRVAHTPQIPAAPAPAPVVAATGLET